MFCSWELLIALKARCCGRSRRSCLQVAGAASTRGPGVMDSAAFLLMAFDCGCQPRPWHCVLAGSVRFVSRAGADSCPWGGWAGGKPCCAGTHPCPALPLFPAGWAGLASTRCECVCVAPDRHSWHVGHSAQGAKPSSWCRWCLAVLPLVQVAQALWHSNQIGCLCHNKLGIFGVFLGAAACGCTSCCDLGGRELWLSPLPAAWLSIPRAISSPALLPVVLLS